MKSVSFFSRTKLVAFILAVFVLGEFLWSMIFPSYNFHHYWIPLQNLNFYKSSVAKEPTKKEGGSYSFDTFDSKLMPIVLDVISDYHVNVDAGGYMLLAHDFPNHYFRGHLTFLTRPLYPFIVSILAFLLHHLISNSYSITFLSGLCVNLLLFWTSAFLFYLLIKDLISARIGFFSAFLFTFSPFAHGWLTQPEADIFGAFALIVSLYLLLRYAQKSSLKKLIFFSLVIGTLLLGKKLFAISFFILFLALYFKRYKEGMLFLGIHLIPFLLWYLWVTLIWNLNFYIDEISTFGVGIWIFNVFNMPWYQTLKQLLDAVPNFINATIYGFILIPVIFALIGFRQKTLKKYLVISQGYMLSFFLLFFIDNIYIARHAFLLFPIIYPAAILGIDNVASLFSDHTRLNPFIYYLSVYGFILTFSNINFYYFLSYGG